MPQMKGTNQDAVQQLAKLVAHYSHCDAGHLLSLVYSTAACGKQKTYLTFKTSK